MTKRIFTHAGMFHADDAFCVAAAKMVFGYDMEVHRVRELPEDFDPNTDVAVDVGGKFSPDDMIFDHHQKGGNDDGRAAIGKFWSVYGPRLQRVSDRVYETLIGSIDRADIGLSDWNPVREDWRHVSASALISSMNPPFGSSEEEVNKAFEVAVEAATFALKGAIAQAVAYIEMQDVVASATSHFDDRVLELSKGGPWQEHIFEQKLEDVLYVVYPSERGGFCIQAVPDKPGSFGMRKPLPKEWRGLRGQDLVSLTGLSESGSATFCHPGGFVGGAEKLSDVLRLAKLATE